MPAAAREAVRADRPAEYIKSIRQDSQVTLHVLYFAMHSQLGILKTNGNHPESIEIIQRQSNHSIYQSKSLTQDEPPNQHSIHQRDLITRTLSTSLQ